MLDAESIGGEGGCEGDDGVPGDADEDDAKDEGAEAHGGDAEEGDAHGEEDQDEADGAEGVGEAEIGPTAVPIGEVSEDEGADDGHAADEAECAGCYIRTVTEVCDVGHDVSIHEAHRVTSYEVAEGELPEEGGLEGFGEGGIAEGEGGVFVVGVGVVADRERAFGLKSHVFGAVSDEEKAHGEDDEEEEDSEELVGLLPGEEFEEDGGGGDEGHAADGAAAVDEAEGEAASLEEPGADDFGEGGAGGEGEADAHDGEDCEEVDEGLDVGE